MFTVVYILMHCPPALIWTDPPPCRDLSPSGYYFGTMVECQDYVRNPPAPGRFYCAEVFKLVLD